MQGSRSGFAAGATGRVGAPWLAGCLSKARQRLSAPPHPPQTTRESVLLQEMFELRRRCLFSACRVVVNGHLVEPDYPKVPAKQGDRFLRGDFVLGEFRPGSMAAMLPPARQTGAFTVMEAGEELPAWVLLRYMPGSHTRTLLVRDRIWRSPADPL